MRAIEMHKHIPGIGLGAAIEISARRTITGTELKIAGGLGIIETSSGELDAVRREIARIYTVKRERELGIVTLIDEAELGEAELGEAEPAEAELEESQDSE